MNKYLLNKDQFLIKQNSANFYALCLYSKYILNNDKYRLDDFKNFYSQLKNLNNSNNNNLSFNFQKLSLYSITSFLLSYKFKSLIIFPLFYANFYLLKWMFPFTANNTDDCFFCFKNEISERNLRKYVKIYDLIEYVFKKEKIKNLDDFEKALDKIIKDYNI